MKLVECYQKYKDPNEQITLNYISDLADQTGNDIRGWDIDNVFSSLGSIVGLQDFRQVNKLFFEKARSTPKSTATRIPESFNDSISSFKKNLNYCVSRKVDNNCAIYIQTITNLQKNIEVEQTKIMNELNKKKMFQEDLEKNMDEVLSHGFFILQAINYSQDYPSSNYIDFSTHPVFLTNKVLGEEITVPMGRYLVRYMPTEPKIVVKPFIENIVSNGYWHPYISRDSIICWGTAQPTASKLLAEGKMPELFALLQTLLTTYHNDSGPHRSLGSFIEDGQINGIPWKKYFEDKAKGAISETQIKTQEQIEEERLQLHDSGECGPECELCEDESDGDGEEDAEF